VSVPVTKTTVFLLIILLDELIDVVAYNHKMETIMSSNNNNDAREKQKKTKKVDDDDYSSNGDSLSLSLSLPAPVVIVPSLSVGDILKEFLDFSFLCSTLHR